MSRYIIKGYRFNEDICGRYCHVYKLSRTRGGHLSRVYLYKGIATGRLSSAVKRVQYTGLYPTACTFVQIQKEGRRGWVRVENVRYDHRTNDDLRKQFLKLNMSRARYNTQ